MSIGAIRFDPKAIAGIGGIDRQQEVQQRGKSSKGGFGEMLMQAVRDVDDMQKDADKQIEGVIMQKEGVNTHDAMIALEKADVAFQLMNQIRGRIVRAYQEVIRTQV